jgi:hypothetical protein
VGVLGFRISTRGALPSGKTHESCHHVFIMNAKHAVRFLKGSVQRKLRWVENGVNRSAGASDYGAGHFFVVLFGFHLDFAIFPFPVSTAQIIGKFWKNR